MKLVLVADVPSVGAARILEVLEAVLPAIAGPVWVVDRDGPRGGGASSDRMRLAHLQRLRELTARHGADLIVSARPDLAAAVGADGVQLPERGLPPEIVRAAFPGLRIGRSCHDRDGLEEATRAGADWATLSPVAAPLSKAASGPPLGVEGFADARRAIPLEVIALGGITAALCGPLREAGADGVATIGAVFQAAQPVQAARALRAHLG